MPIYCYELCDGEEPCARCGNGFELHRPLSAPPLEKCPLCRKRVRKVITPFNTPTVMKPVSTTDAKNAGFAVYKKIGSGEYERQ
jgi:putative FmdB family regulatory protein